MRWRAAKVLAAPSVGVGPRQHKIGELQNLFNYVLQIIKIFLDRSDHAFLLQSDIEILGFAACVDMDFREIAVQNHQNRALACVEGFSGPIGGPKRSPA